VEEKVCGSILDFYLAFEWNNKGKRWLTSQMGQHPFGALRK
jgi:hypothetical protein